MTEPSEPITDDRRRSARRLLRPTATTVAIALLAWIGVAGATTGPGPDTAATPSPRTGVLGVVALGTGSAPVAVADSYRTAVGQSLTVTAPGVLANDADPEGDPISAVLRVGPANGSLTFLSVGAFVYTPSAGFTGADSFTYSATDGTGVSAPAVVTLEVGTGPPTTSVPGTTTTTTAPTTTVPVTTTTPVPTTTAPSTTVPPGTPDGAILYAQSCASCHGPGGTGGFAPSLLGTTLSTAQLVSITTSGAGAMPAFGASLTGAQIQAIADYVAGLQPGGPPPPVPPPPTASGPEAVFAAFCASCHGPAGAGTPLGPDVRGEEIREIFSVVRTGDDSMPPFGPAVISDADLDELAAWIADLTGADSDRDGDDGNRPSREDDEDDDERDDDSHDKHDDEHDDDEHDDDEHDDERAGRLVVVRDDDDAVKDDD